MIAISNNITMMDPMLEKTMIYSMMWRNNEWTDLMWQVMKHPFTMINNWILWCDNKGYCPNTTTYTDFIYMYICTRTMMDPLMWQWCIPRCDNNDVSHDVTIMMDPLMWQQWCIPWCDNNDVSPDVTTMMYPMMWQ